MIKTLHALRFVFIMLIVMSHYPSMDFDFGGEVGVSFFFMLSGFVLSYAYGHRVLEGQFHTMSFLWKQLSKFYPLHLLMLVFMALLNWRLSITYSWTNLLTQVLLVQSWVLDESFYFGPNGPAWFLSDLVFFYVIFAAALRLLMKLSLRRLFLLTLLVAGVYMLLLQIVPERLEDEFYVFPIFRIIDFFIGILICRLFRSDAVRQLAEWLQCQSSWTMTLLESLAVGWILVASLFFDDVVLRYRCASYFWLFVPPFLLFFALSDNCKGWLTQMLQWPLLQSLGSVSLEIYLAHMFLLRVFVHVLQLDEGSVSNPLYKVLFFVFVGIASYLIKRVGALQKYVQI